MDERVTEMLACIEHNPDDIGAYVELGHALRLNGAYAAAMTAYAEAERRECGDSWLFGGRGLIAKGIGATWSTHHFFLAGVEREPGSLELTLHAGLSAADLGWYDHALAHLAKLPAELPGWWASSRADVQRAAQEARRRVNAVLRALPRTVIERDMALTLATDLIGLGRLGAAGALLAPLLAAAPADGEVRRLVARLAMRRDGLNAAIAIATGPDAPLQADQNLTRFAASLLVDAGHHEAAFTILFGLPRSTWDWSTWQAACNILLFTGDPVRLLACARDWASLASADDAQPWRYVLAALRLSDDLPLWQALPRDRVAAIASAATILADTLPIVQFWDSPDLPEDVRRTIDTWAQHNPGVRRVLLDEPQAHAFLLERFGEPAARRFRASHHPAMKADILRLYYLLANGGIYCDADERALSSIRPVFETLTECEFVASMSSEAAPYVHNWFFAARPGARVIARAITMLESSFDAALDHAAAAGIKPPIWGVTGPGLITRAIAAVLTECGDMAERSSVITLMPEHRYHRFAHTDEDLGYKRTVAGNWRLS